MRRTGRNSPSKIRRAVLKEQRGANPRDIRLILVGLLLVCGSAVSLKMPVGGAVLCDHGLCLQTHYASFGTVTESAALQADAISGFLVEVDPADAERSRVTLSVHGEQLPMTAGFGGDGRDIERIANDGNRFLRADREDRLTLRYEERSLIQLLSLALLLAGAASSGWLFSQRRGDHS